MALPHECAQTLFLNNPKFYEETNKCLGIHTDTRKETVNISKEDDKNLATDIYVDKETHYAKTEWADNRGLLFIQNEKWHAQRI